MLCLLAAVLIANCAFRIWLVSRPIDWQKGDENTYAGQIGTLRRYGFGAFRKNGADFVGCQGFWGMSPPTRVVPVVLASLLHRWSRDDRLSLAWIATASGCVLPALAAITAWSMVGSVAGLTAAILTSTQPISLGMGRRALVDVPALAAQMGVMASACLGPDWWPATALALVVAGLTRESVRSAAPAFALALAIVFGWPWGTVGVTIAVAVSAYCVSLRAIVGVWPWRMPSAFVGRVIRGIKTDPNKFPWQQCRGGAHRLMINLAQLSPLVLIVALWGSGWSPRTLALAVCSGVVLLGYGLPWLDQQIRSASFSDNLLRLAAAFVCPLWLLPALIAFDAYVWYRVWVRARIFDPTTSNLGRALAMLPREAPFPKSNLIDPPQPTVDQLHAREAAVQDSPDDPSAVFDLAEAHYYTGSHELAFGRYVEALKLLKGAPDDQRVFWALYQLGNIHQQLGNDLQAIQAWQASYESRPTRAEPVVALSRWYNDHGLPEMALLHAEKAMAMRIDGRDTLHLDPMCYGRDKAEAECFRACKLADQMKQPAVAAA